MSDTELRELERRWLESGTEDAKQTWLNALSRAGRMTWVLRYGEDSVGLDRSIVSLFSSREGALEHITNHKKRFVPGIKYGGGLARDRIERGRFSDGYRNLVLEPHFVQQGPGEEWFCKEPGE